MADAEPGFDLLELEVAAPTRRDRWRKGLHGVYSAADVTMMAVRPPITAVSVVNAALEATGEFRLNALRDVLPAVHIDSRAEMVATLAAIDAQLASLQVAA